MAAGAALLALLLLALPGAPGRVARADSGEHRPPPPRVPPRAPWPLEQHARCGGGGGLEEEEAH